MSSSNCCFLTCIQVSQEAGLCAKAWPWGATPCPRSGVATESARLWQRRSSGQEELPHVWGQGWQQRGTTPHLRSEPRPRRDTTSLRSGAVAERSYLTSKKLQLHGRRRTERSYSTFKVRRGGREEIPLVQGKEQRLLFAGAAVKRYPTSEVRGTQVRR